MREGKGLRGDHESGGRAVSVGGSTSKGKGKHVMRPRRRPPVLFSCLGRSCGGVCVGVCGGVAERGMVLQAKDGGVKSPEAKVPTRKKKEKNLAHADVFNRVALKRPRKFRFSFSAPEVRPKGDGQHTHRLTDEKEVREGRKILSHKEHEPMRNSKRVLRRYFRVGLLLLRRLMTVLHNDDDDK